MCEGIKGWVPIGTICCYNSYHNGSTCVQCLAGYYGSDCLKHCDSGFYGERCAYKCNCDNDICNHIIGCLTDFKESSISLPKNSAHISPQHVSTISKSHSTVYSTSKSSESISESYVTTSFFTTESTNDVITTSSKRPYIATNNNKPLDTNIYLMAIGGVIALLLGILVIQFCIKLYWKRHKYSQQLSLKQTQRTSVVQQETTLDTNESSMNNRLYFSPSEHHQPAKNFESKTVLTVEVYEKINSQVRNQKKANSNVLISTDSDSNISSTSYLKPESSKQRSYTDVKESFSAMNETYNMDSLF